MYRIIVTVQTDQRSTAEQVARIIIDLFSLKTLMSLGVTATIEEE